MAISLRQTEILEIARGEGRVFVEDLAQRFDVALQTIRRDLTDLANAGLLDRVHSAAAIPDNSSIILNLGTTTEAVARELLLHRNITVVTNNMNVANILLPNPGCDIMVAGGALRRSDGGLVGDLTSEFFGQFKVDYAVIGASAIDPDGDLLDFDVAEVRVSRAILKQARHAFLVCDHSKLGRSAPALLGSLSQISAWFTDQPLPPTLSRRCADWGTEIRVAG